MVKKIIILEEESSEEGDAEAERTQWGMQLVGPKEAAALLGISTITLGVLAKKNEIPYYQFGNGRVRKYSIKELKHYIQSLRVDVKPGLYGRPYVFDTRSKKAKKIREEET